MREFSNLGSSTVTARSSKIVIVLGVTRAGTWCADDVVEYLGLRTDFEYCGRPQFSAL